jgi:hypothetical protein
LKFVSTIRLSFARAWSGGKLGEAHPQVLHELPHRRKIQPLGATNAGEVCHIAQFFRKDAAQFACRNQGEA